MGLKETIHRILNTPAEITIQKARGKIIDLYKLNKIRTEDKEKCSYLENPSWLTHLENGLLPLHSVQDLSQLSDIIRKIANQSILHEFNVLGSGWTRVGHDSSYSGRDGIAYNNPAVFSSTRDFIIARINASNQAKSESILSLLPNDYSLIDWQLDFISGYKWDSTHWYRDLRFGMAKGAEVKVPWELGRMQHLIYLAYASVLSNNGSNGFLSADVYFNEFCNQILDFIGSNPPRYGVQWMSSMDVSIRIANWLICFDIFKSLGYTFDNRFMQIFLGSVYQHGLHILENLEWSSGMRANHYLANIAGVVFLAAFLPISQESSLWLAFGIQELIIETLYQFNEDGSNFEASVAYHKQSAEFVIYSLAILVSIQENKIRELSSYRSSAWNFEKKLKSANKQLFAIENDCLVFPNEFWDRIIKIIKFSQSTALTSVFNSSVGDCDGGCFLNIPLDKSIFQSDEKPDSEILFNTSTHQDTISFLRGALGINEIEFDNQKLMHKFGYECFKKYRLNLNEETNTIKQVYLGILHELNNVDLTPIQFPEFGFYIFKNEVYKVIIRCGKVGQNGKGGHSHNDQLSFELVVNDKLFFADPGTYCYTSFPAKRNLYRSTSMHNTLAIEGREQNLWFENEINDLFWIVGERTLAKPIKIEKKLFIGEHHGFEAPHARVFRFRSNYFDVRDECEEISIKSINFHLSPDCEIEQLAENSIKISNSGIAITLSTDVHKFIISDYKFSPSYGILLNAKKISLIDVPDSIIWKVEINNLI